MHDIDAWVSSLQGPPAPTAIPDVRGRARRRRWMWAGVGGGLAMAASALLFVSTTETTSQLRGTADLPQVYLRVAIEGPDGAARVRHGGTHAVGEIAWFRVGAEGSTPVTVWVDGPEGRQILADRLQTDHEGRDLRTKDGFLVYELARPGRYTFFASSLGVDHCEPNSCDRVPVEVR